jgi:oligopeptide/dipeptide ABC transporter ATP-binding protein
MMDLIKWQQKEKASITGILGISKDGDAAEDRAMELLKSVHLPSPSEILKRYPVELSGGMRQRILIAMSLIKRPSLLLADEPTTALDVTVQKEILNLLEEKVRDEKLSVLYITHDLGVAKRLCDRIYVMYSGNIVETALTSELLKNPLHPYTQGLLNSIPKLTEGEIKGIEGSIPDNINPPSGCRFHPRCFMAKEVCRLYKPTPMEINHTHLIACQLYNEVKKHEKQ